MTLDNVKKYILQNSEEEIYSKFLLGQDVWYFREHIKNENSLLFYDKFKNFISSKLSIRFNNISIMGSAKTQFSFAPKKDFKKFDKFSDFDLILVSEKLFGMFWDAYYEISREQYLKNYFQISSNIFRKFITIKDSDNDYSNSILQNWQRDVTQFKTQLQVEFRIFNEINYRIYSDWDAVESYHLNSLTKLKERLNEINRTN
ncbi:MAG: hypothetical protein J0M18_18785 [Ignavibacteria bacterium]|nr:hypothetical protein [Ignavibacteria bacterium]